MAIADLTHGCAPHPHPAFAADPQMLEQSSGLTAILPVFAQNWFFVLRKR